MSSFTKERNKISCDESIKDNEELEVVYKEQRIQSESVKEFVERKIKEYKKAEENFEMFVNKPNLKENDIKRKMNRIKTKYTKINKKLKKLDRLKPNLVKGNTNDEIDSSLNAVESKLTEECTELGVEANNNNPRDDDRITVERTKSNIKEEEQEKEEQREEEKKEEEQMEEEKKGKEQREEEQIEEEQIEEEEEDGFRLKAEGVVDGARVSSCTKYSHLTIVTHGLQRHLERFKTTLLFQRNTFEIIFNS